MGTISSLPKPLVISFGVIMRDESTHSFARRRQARNDLLNVASRSMIKYFLSFRKPSRGVKIFEQTLWPMNSKLASSAQAQFWVELESRLDGTEEKSSQNDHTAQQRTHQLNHKLCRECGRRPS